MTEVEKKIFNYLLECGCCKICAVRYLCNKSLDLGDLDTYLTENAYIATQNGSPQIEAKKLKTNPCTVCLGLLQGFCLHEILRSSDLSKAKEYDSPTFTCSISMSPTVLLREHSMKLHLLDKFPNFYTNDNVEIPLNRAWKMFVKNQLGEYVGKSFENSDVCNFSINVAMQYKFDLEELDVLKSMQPKIFEQRNTQHRKYNGELFTRKGVLNALSLTSSGVFKMYAVVPPEVPTEFLSCKAIDCKHNPIYIAGRYCKFSRNLSQSPWIIDGNKMMDTSVQEVIFEKVSHIFSITEDKLKFASSGREDCDVRCLGNGRPFYIEISDPRKTTFTFEELRNLETAINISPLIKVSDLQIVPKFDLVKIKEGEDSKTKDYNALCFTKEKVSQEFIDKLNSFAPADINQRTPIRVLHRRPLAVRIRKIYEMKAKLVPGKPFLIDLWIRTQAGTYIKEFIHGDFGRTIPNVSEIIKSEADIIALDVVAINLDWPEKVIYDNK